MLSRCAKDGNVLDTCVHIFTTLTDEDDRHMWREVSDFRIPLGCYVLERSFGLDWVAQQEAVGLEAREKMNQRTRGVIARRYSHSDNSTAAIARNLLAQLCPYKNEDETQIWFGRCADSHHNVSEYSLESTVIVHAWLSNLKQKQRHIRSHTLITLTASLTPSGRILRGTRFACRRWASTSSQPPRRRPPSLSKVAYR